MFGSDESDDEEKKKLTEQRLKAYAEKKAKKPGVIAKSNVIYDVKPFVFLFFGIERKFFLKVGRYN